MIILVIGVVLGVVIWMNKDKIKKYLGLDSGAE